jgi:hypothetical protein
MKRLAPLALIALAGTLPAEDPKLAAVPVVVELFTSQG